MHDRRFDNFVEHVQLLGKAAALRADILPAGEPYIIRMEEQGVRVEIVLNQEGSRIISGPENGQPEYQPLEITVLPCGSIKSRWSLSFKERVKVLFGAHISLGIITRQQPPVWLAVGDEEGIK